MILSYFREIKYNMKVTDQKAYVTKCDPGGHISECSHSLHTPLSDCTYNLILRDHEKKERREKKEKRKKNFLHFLLGRLWDS